MSREEELECLLEAAAFGGEGRQVLAGIGVVGARVAYDDLGDCGSTSERSATWTYMVIISGPDMGIFSFRQTTRRDLARGCPSLCTEKRPRDPPRPASELASASEHTKDLERANREDP